MLLLVAVSISRQHIYLDCALSGHPGCFNHTKASISETIDDS